MPRFLLEVEGAGELDGKYSRFGKDETEARSRLLLDLEELGAGQIVSAEEIKPREEWDRA